MGWPFVLQVLGLILGTGLLGILFLGIGERLRQRFLDRGMLTKEWLTEWTAERNALLDGRFEKSDKRLDDAIAVLKHEVKDSFQAPIQSLGYRIDQRLDGLQREMDRISGNVEKSMTQSRKAEDDAIEARHQSAMANEQIKALKDLLASNERSSSEQIKALKELLDTRLGHIEAMMQRYTERRKAGNE